MLQHNRLALVNDFLANNNVTILEHSPYPPNLVPANFSLFPQPKSALKGWHFCDANDIKNAMEELKRLSLNGFQECFQNLYGIGRSVQLHKTIL
jgi:hypothetical protein